MKQIVIVGLAVIGGFAVYKYLRRTPFGQAFTPQQTGQQPRTTVGALVAGVVPGVPAFAGAPAINRPDQIAAGLVTNPLATVDGSEGYSPAFGPLENQPDGMLSTF